MGRFQVPKLLGCLDSLSFWILKMHTYFLPWTFYEHFLCILISSCSSCLFAWAPVNDKGANSIILNTSIEYIYIYIYPSTIWRKTEVIKIKYAPWISYSIYKLRPIYMCFHVEVCVYSLLNSLSAHPPCFLVGTV